jgi:uncharacterized protein YidB (DUF937 family)
MAIQARIATESISSQLTDLLPNIIDKLTPDENLPDSNLLEKGLEMLRGMR